MRSLLDFDEINRLTEYSFKLNKEQKNKEAFISDIESILINAYVLGIEEANKDLRTDYEPDIGSMSNEIYRKVEGKTFTDRIDEYFGAPEKEYPKIQRVVETEAHRMLNSGVSFVGGKATADGTNVYKTWATMGDAKVRDTHSYLEGMTIPFTEKFFTFDGDSALYCGGFANAENNVNCRCWIKLTTD